MNQKLFIGNCAFNLDESTLESFITSNDVQVSSIKIISDRETGRSRGFAFAELSGSQSIDDAIEKLNGKELEGRALTVNEAREQSRNNDRNRNGGNRNYRGDHSARW